MDKLVGSALAVVFTLAGGVVAPAAAQQNQTKPPQRTIVIERPINRPPPPPHERTYVGPGPTVTPPMERLPQVAPLAQPPIR